MKNIWFRNKERVSDGHDKVAIAYVLLLQIR